MVNIAVRRLINSTNIRMGYNLIEIISPEEVTGDARRLTPQTGPSQEVHQQCRPLRTPVRLLERSKKHGDAEEVYSTLNYASRRG